MDELSGHGDLATIHDAHRRLVAAFEGIAAGTEALAIRAAEAPSAEELSRLRAEIDEERVTNAQLSERIRALREREGEREPEGDRLADLEGRLTQAHEAITSLEAQRAAERAEMDAVLAELMPLVEGSD